VAKYINETISGKFDEQDLNELYSQVDSTERKIKDFTERCQNGPVGPYLCQTRRLTEGSYPLGKSNIAD
jgi:hypothetical protein